MILLMDLNPVLKRKYCLEYLDFNNVNIPSSLINSSGGDGIELAQLLNGFKETVLVSGFLGGINGSFIHRELQEITIPHEYFSIKEESADSIIITTENGDEIIIKSRGPRITREELGGFLELCNSLLEKASIICCVGDLPFNVPKEIFLELITNGNKLNKKTLLAIKGEELSYGIEAKPYIVAIDKVALEEYTNLELNYEYEIIKAGLYILEKGVNIVVVSLGIRGSIVLTSEKVYRVDIPNNDTKNFKVNLSYMIGGFAMAMDRNYDFDMVLKIGHACGIVNYYNKLENTDMSDIKKIMSDIEINIFNY